MTRSMEKQRRSLRRRIARTAGIIPIGKSIDIRLNRIDVISNAVRVGLPHRIWNPASTSSNEA